MTSDPLELAKRLTIHEYVILRQIKFMDGWRCDQLSKLKKFDLKVINSLMRKKILKKEERSDYPYLYTSADADTIIQVARDYLGISSL